MSALATKQEVPAWAVQLKNPPPHKSKQTGIPDPPGYPSLPLASNSKVAPLQHSPTTRLSMRR